MISFLGVGGKLKRDFMLPLGDKLFLTLLCDVSCAVFMRWQDKIPDTEVLKKANMQSVYTLLKLAQLRWTGHVTRMPDERLPKKVLHRKVLIRWP